MHCYGGEIEENYVEKCDRDGGVSKTKKVEGGRAVRSPEEEQRS